MRPRITVILTAIPDSITVVIWPIAGARNLKKSVKTKIGFVEPMLSLAVAKLPEGAAWSYELKFDGYRTLGLRKGGRLQLLSRNGKDFTRRFAFDRS
jgi:ATP-dependent DNA ligase